MGLSFECTTDGMETLSRASPGKAVETVAALAGKGFSMTSTVKFLQFLHLGALRAWRCAQAATIKPVKVLKEVSRAAPRQIFPLALLPGCSCV
jgi:hypothetical protein